MCQAETMENEDGAPCQSNIKAKPSLAQLKLSFDSTRLIKAPLPTTAHDGLSGKSLTLYLSPTWVRVRVSWPSPFLLGLLELGLGFPRPSLFLFLPLSFFFFFSLFLSPPPSRAFPMLEHPGTILYEPILCKTGHRPICPLIPI